MPVTHFKQSKVDAQGLLVNGKEVSVDYGSGTISGAGPLTVTTALSTVRAAVAVPQAAGTGTTVTNDIAVSVSGSDISISHLGASDDASIDIFWIAVGDA
ncbi:TPA: hypothetical protein EYP37_07990 [Candidatus Poribacteria bacterium]|nr:hypothetical protein [Candidatus Poribacteria bacterium]